jgi:DNA-binding NarL/FixJ family response regulator
MSGRLRILIVDDHPIVRQGLRQTLGDAADVGEIGGTQSYSISGCLAAAGSTC